LPADVFLLDLGRMLFLRVAGDKNHIEPALRDRRRVVRIAESVNRWSKQVAK